MAVTSESLRADTQARIVDAAFRAVSTFGLSRFTMEDVAREADLSRQSVYRYFDSKDALVTELVYREEEAFISGVRAAYARHEDLESAIREALTFCFDLARRHPLLDRLLAAEPEVLLPYLTTRGGGVIERATRVMEELAAGRPDVDPALAHRAADLSARLTVSYALTPTDEPPHEVASEIARILTRALSTKEATT
ncbi:MAG: TetR family transcriptional regulator [Actinobacteria bacterium]|nr:TetR family transcriptional regulator [Actinomycetota bacterium]